MRLTILYDNYPKNGLKADWGFSVLIRTDEGKNILFDTGKDPDILRYNIKKLGVLKDGDSVEHLVISHAHHDHIGGTPYIFSAFNIKHIWLPRDAVIQGIPDVAQVHRDEEGWIEKNIYLLRNLPARSIMEQALLLRGEVDVLLVGCNHPGLYEVLSQVVSRIGKYPDWVIGGLHLYRTPGHVIEKMWNDLRYKLRKIAPIHCSGDRARRRLLVDWKEGLLDVGLGDTITI